LDARTHYTFEVISPTEEPKLPKKLPTHSRNNAEFWLGITSRSAFESGNGTDDSEYVAERYKESLWNDLMAHSNLLECEDEAAAIKLRAKVK
jgi:hypothetical protein